MRAIVRDRFGDTKVLHLDEVPRLLPRDHGVGVRVAAASLDHGAWHAMTGLSYLSRLIFWVRRPKDSVLAPTSRAAWVAVGPAVKGLRRQRGVGLRPRSSRAYALVAEDVLLDPTERPPVLAVDGWCR